jgi:hypothetical protein
MRTSEVVAGRRHGRASYLACGEHRTPFAVVSAQRSHNRTAQVWPVFGPRSAKPHWVLALRPHAQRGTSEPRRQAKI